MNIVVISSSKGKRALIEASARLYEQELGLTNSTYTVEIKFKKGLAKTERLHGYVMNLGPKYLLLMLDANLKDEMLFETLAHEMVHVKQRARGQYKIKNNRVIWLGKVVKAKYYDRPWEIDAMKKEKVLASKIYAIIRKGKL